MTLKCHRWLTVVLVLVAPVGLRADVPTDPADVAKQVGQPTTLAIQPAAVQLSGSRAMQQIIVNGHYAGGVVRDLTPFAKFTIEPAGLVKILEGGFLRPLKDGTGALVIEAGGQTTKIPVTVAKAAEAVPVSFRHDVIAALNVGGCNAGACHGTPTGKNGFRLSLRGFDPATDLIQLTRDIYGRRTDRLEPMQSLLLLKGLGRVAHEGGARFQASSVGVEMIRGWLEEGLSDDPAGLPAVTKVEVLPGSRVLMTPAKWQQLAVLAHFADGSIRDVTRLTSFSTSDTGVADVSLTGLVEFKQSGEVAVLCRYLEEMQSVRLTYLEPKEGFVWAPPPVNNYVDEHVFAKLKLLSIPPSDLCTDAEFIRRAYLDSCGLLPTTEEVKAFLADSSTDKRARLVDTLMQRPEFADFWAMKWADVLRANRKTIQLKGVHGYQRWLRQHFVANTPFDAMVRELLTASGDAHNNPPANFYRIARDPQNLAETSAQLFFGVRMACAKCHNHPFERWTQDDYYSTAAWFARVKQRKILPTGAKPNDPNATEVVYVDRAGEVSQPRTGQVMKPKFLGGAVPEIAANQDRREVFAEWLTRTDNPFFAKSVVNRVWFHLNGKGIVDPVDDFRDSNPACNDELLDALAKDFAENGYDMRRLVRTIMTSRTYQLSAEPNELNKDDTKYFSHAVTKLLTAEQLLDAICDVMQLPETYAGLPAGTRAIQLPDGEVNHPFLKTFGQPARELACECERESDSNLAQALQLINGPTINEKIRNPQNRLGKLLEAKKPEAEVLNDLYLAALSRPPLPAEVSASLDHVSKATDKRKAWEDVLWAIINTREFLFRH